ncbi:Ig-like domain-containing protein [Candidatus Entotheonella palauensis]|uniref:Ig-like domain-containing protein n=1 Tax=Candidatus Entotheonella palauensis TaxID=93172 RepID=UPI000B7C887C|nr:Ig-like domain-containing protein [Candidatus Entotheonella palauensis]
MTGANARGCVAQWTKIIATDGQIALRVVQDQEHFDGPKAYALTSIMLREKQPLATEPLLTRITSTSPADGEGGVAITRETILRLSQPLAVSTVVDDTTLFAEFGGNRLPARRHISSNRDTVTLFYQKPLPPGARVRLTIVGDTLLDEHNRPVDVDSDGEEGGIAHLTFDTLGLTQVLGTVVTGRVFASELAPGDRGMSVNVPLEGVVITVDGMEETLRAETDSSGNFRLENAPAGRFFVHIDGRQATNQVPEGAYYPFVGKAWAVIPGEATNITISIGNQVAPSITQGQVIRLGGSIQNQAHPEAIAGHTEGLVLSINNIPGP